MFINVTLLTDVGWYNCCIFSGGNAVINSRSWGRRGVTISVSMLEMLLNNYWSLGSDDIIIISSVSFIIVEMSTAIF
jgi:hypothetical protein